MFIYKTTHTNGKYYIGRCSRKYPDSYLGSGRWVQSIKDKSQLTRVILSEHKTFEDLCKAEEQTIAKHIHNPLCMNYNNKSVGFASGKLNPSSKLKGVKKGDMKEETKNKLSKIFKEKYKDPTNHPLYGKEHPNKGKSLLANSSSYLITYEDGTTEEVIGLKPWCLQNDYNDIVFHRMHKQGKPYRGMTYIKLNK